MFPAIFNLTSLNGQNGFIVNGVNIGDGLGQAASYVGDVNGDGITDIIIGASGANNSTGQSYVIFGSKNFNTIFNLTSLNGQNGFLINGINVGDDSGEAASYAGDINGDGIDDIVVGAFHANNNAGQSYVIFGNRNFDATFDLTGLNGQNGFVINGINTGDYSGEVISYAGDVNSDGIADIIIGANGANNNAGQSYVIFGNRNFDATFDLTGLNGQNGFVINGINAGDFSGVPVSYAGDVNSDGIDDIIVGAEGANGAGQSYVVFGSKNFDATFNLTGLNGQNGFVINGINVVGSATGAASSYAGDVNNDGIADIIIGAPGINNSTGQSYVIFGNKNFNATFNLTSLNGQNGFLINGINIHNFLGISANYAGDVNNDGITDIIIGAYLANNYAGQSYVIYGNKNFNSIFDLTSLNGQNGFIINGINLGDYSGAPVSYAGDINNDGIADIIIGASSANNNAGQSYVIFGESSSIDTPIIF